MYNSLVASVLGRRPKEAPNVPSELDLVFEVKTHPVDKITVVVDMQTDRTHTLAGELCLREKGRRFFSTGLLSVQLNL